MSFFSDLKGLLDDNNKKEVENIINKLPDNELLAKEVLQDFDSKTKIELKDDIKNSYYVFLNDTIYLSNTGKSKDSYARLILIMHEIRHSMQSKVLQVLNFSLSNLEIISFVISAILIIFKINIKSVLIIYGVIVLLSIIPRIILEVDAIINSVRMSRNYLIRKVSLKETDVVLTRCKGTMTFLAPCMFISLFLGRFVRYFLIYLLTIIL